MTFTGYSPPHGEGDWPEAVALDYEAAKYLAALPIRAIGTDAYNVESMTDQSPVPTNDEIAQIIPGHHAFLSKGIPVFEQLVNVDKSLGNETMYFVGAPLNIKDGDGMMVLMRPADVCMLRNSWRIECLASMSTKQAAS